MSDLFMQILITTTTSSVIVGLLIFILKSWIRGLFKKDIEGYKGEVQKQLFKHKVILEENTRNYNTIYENLEIAYGASGKILNRAQLNSDWSNCNEEDIRVYLSSRDTPKGKSDEIVSSFIANRENGVEALNTFIKQLDQGEARRLTQKSKNNLILKGIWIDKDIEILVEDFNTQLMSCIIEYGVFLRSGDYKLFNQGADNFSKLNKKLLNIKSNIREKLLTE